MINITFSKDWSFTEADTSMKQRFKPGVEYKVANAVAIAAAKDGASFTPAALDLLKASGGKAARASAISKMSKEDMAAELKAARDAVKAYDKAKEDLAKTQSKFKDLETEAAENAQILDIYAKNEASIVKLFNQQSGSQVKSLTEMIGAMQDLGRA